MQCTLTETAEQKNNKRLVTVCIILHDHAMPHVSYTLYKRPLYARLLYENLLRACVKETVCTARLLDYQTVITA